jgi:hypothetical protein
LRFLKRPENRATVWSNNTTSGHISSGSKIHMLKRSLQSHFYYSTIHNSWDMKSTQISIDWWMDKENMARWTIGEEKGSGARGQQRLYDARKLGVLMIKVCLIHAQLIFANKK